MLAQSHLPRLSIHWTYEPNNTTDTIDRVSGSSGLCPATCILLQAGLSCVAVSVRCVALPSK
jgi:hypothetical protein